MEVFMNIKLAIKKFVGKNDVFITPVLKFLMTLLAMMKISSGVGYMSRLASRPVILIVALAGSFLPTNLTLVILAVIVLAHMYALAMEVALVVLILFLILFLLYFRFASEDAVAGLLTPIAMAFHLPYVMPVAMGLTGTPASMISVGSGAIIYEVLHFISQNADDLTTATDDSKIGQFKTIIDGVLGNKEMITLVVAFAVTVLVVYLVRRLSINYAWLIAIGAGELAQFFLILILGARLGAGIGAGSLFAGILVSTLINLILCYYCFDLNYRRTEKVQFEDDEYYYYVKAIPKNDYLSKPEPKAKPQTPSREASYRTRPTQNPDVKITSPIRTSRTAQSEPVRTSTPARTVSSSQTEKETDRVVRKSPITDVAAAAIRNRDTSVEDVKVRSSSRGPLGLSGGRPAGEGRRLQEQREAQKKNNE